MQITFHNNVSHINDFQAKPLSIKFATQIKRLQSFFGNKEISPSIQPRIKDRFFELFSTNDK